MILPKSLFTIFLAISFSACTNKESGNASYLELQKKFDDLQMKYADLENTHKVAIQGQRPEYILKTQCDDLVQAREQDLKSCRDYELFKVPAHERGIGFSVKDVFGAGCIGQITGIEKRFDKHRGDSETPFQADVEIKFEQDRLVVRNLKKSVVPNQSNEKFDISLFDYKIRQNPPSAVLGRFYEMTEESSGGSLDKGIYKYKYIINKNAENKLEVTFEGEQAEQLQMGMLGLKSTYKISCVGKTLDELIAISGASNTDVSKKLFGN